MPHIIYCVREWIVLSCRLHSSRCKTVITSIPLTPPQKNQTFKPPEQRDKRTIAHKLHGKHEFVVFCKLTDMQVIYRASQHL